MTPALTPPFAPSAPRRAARSLLILVFSIGAATGSAAAWAQSARQALGDQGGLNQVQKPTTGSTTPDTPAEAINTQDTAPPAKPPIALPGSRWVAAQWAQLPGVAADNLTEAWNAWLRNCGDANTARKIHPALTALCPALRALSIASDDDKRTWMQQTLQPWRVLPPEGGEIKGLLTGYYEPLIEATRQASEGFAVPLYAPPPAVNISAANPWFSRQEIDTQPAAQAALAGRALLYVADPVQALVVQIQGSARVRLLDNTANASPASSGGNAPRLLRLAYAGNNGHPYRSVGSWLLAQGALRDASWPGIATWAAANPQRVNDMLWSNPRVVFFKLEPSSAVDDDLQTGPRGAQGVPLTAGRSIAVDPRSLPYGSPVWLASEGAVAQSAAPKLQRLVFAQDTGSAIVGAVRADYFVGTGTAAGELAGRLKQGLALWVLWPKF
jgi:membrane-bound lytic murein transglycosylase A